MKLELTKAQQRALTDLLMNELLDPRDGVENEQRKQMLLRILRSLRGGK